MIEAGNTNAVLISCVKEFERGIPDFVDANPCNKVRAGRTVEASFGLSTRTSWIVNVFLGGRLIAKKEAKGRLAKWLRKISLALESRYGRENKIWP